MNSFGNDFRSIAALASILRQTAGERISAAAVQPALIMREVSVGAPMAH
jgi:hypothetical protein